MHDVEEGDQLSLEADPARRDQGRPRRHVIMTRLMVAATGSGSHPPWRTFAALPAKKLTSRTPNDRANAAICQCCQR